MNQYVRKPDFSNGPPMAQQINNDPIRPLHYHEGGIDVFAYGEANFTKEEMRGFFKGNIIKYITRFNKKNGVEDLRKAQEYLKELIRLEEKQ